MILQFIENMRKTTGTLAKGTMLSTMPQWTGEVFNYALNPYNNYNVRGLDKVDVATCGQGVIDQSTFELLDRLNAGGLAGSLARAALSTYARNLTVNDAVVLDMILSGKLRLGLGIKTLNKYLNKKIPVHETKLASKIDIENITFPLWASPKLDGMRAEVRDGRVLSRTGKPIIGQQHILDVVDPLLPLDGELMIPNLPFEVSLGQLRSHADNPDSVLFVFDTPIPGIKFEDRLETINQLKGKYGCIKVLKHELVHNLDELMAFYKKCRLLGLEGVVTKRVGHLFTTGRNKDWQKMKEVNSMDLPIVGMVEGEGKFEGTLGAVIVRLPDGQTTNVGTGFSDLDRNEFWCNQKEFKGRIMEVQYHEETLAGNLRHPRYFRMRPDKVQ